MADITLTVDPNDLFELMVAVESHVGEQLASPVAHDRQAARLTAERLMRIGTALRESGWVPSPAQQARISAVVRTRPTSLRLASPGQTIAAARIDTAPRGRR